MSIIQTSPVVILCCCVKGIYVEELKRQTALPKLIASAAKAFNDYSSETEDENNQNFPKSYQTCIFFYRKLKAKTQIGMKWIVFLYFN